MANRSRLGTCARHLSRRVRAFVDFLEVRFAGMPYWDRCLEDDQRPPP
jgi:hypothetical protein